MPTGYTANVVDGSLDDFPTFALQCARNFGACIMLRDSSDAVLPTPENVVGQGDWLTTSLATARARLANLQAMTPQQASEAAAADHAARLAGWKEHIENARLARERCMAMFAKVGDWQPPTKGHEGLKEFMAKQLRETAEFDGRVLAAEPPRKLAADEWLARELWACRDRIARDEEGLKEEAERNATRRSWVKALRDSLGAPAVTP